MNVTQRLALATFALSISTDAHAFDSKCRAPDGAECEPGPVTARTRWQAPESEHLRVWERVVAPMGLPQHLREPITLKVATGHGVVAGVQTVQPRPFARVERMVERSYTLAEMTQLPDLSYSLWDWVAGQRGLPPVVG